MLPTGTKKYNSSALQFQEQSHSAMQTDRAGLPPGHVYYNTQTQSQKGGQSL